jgi:hypothetical protein
MPACHMGVVKTFFYGIVFGLIELVTVESVLLEMYETRPAGKKKIFSML